MTAEVFHKKGGSAWIERAFWQVAFAEGGELYPEHPHRLKSLSDIFTEVAFAEAGVDFRLETEELKPPKVCVKGETASGFCI